MSTTNPRLVVVTGGLGALGGAVVQALGAAGYDPRVPGLEVDLREEDQVEAWYGALGRAPWASVHLVGGFAMGPLRDAPLAAWRTMLDLNATTAFLCCRAAARRMREGAIVNVAARAAVEPRTGAGMAAYTASKATVAALSVALADELAPIRVNAIAPGTMDTPANRAAMPTVDPATWMPPAAVAALVVHLIAPDNPLTGAVIPAWRG